MPFRDMLGAVWIIVCVLAGSALCTVVIIGLAEPFGYARKTQTKDTLEQFYNTGLPGSAKAQVYELYGVRVDGKTYWYCDEEWIEIEEPCKAEGDKQ